MSTVTYIGETITPQEFIKRQQAMLFDKEFDDLLRRNAEEKAKEQAKQEKQDKFIALTITLADCEDEICILEDLYKQYLLDSDRTLNERNKLKQDITNLKVKESKTKKQIDDIIKSEK